jgi:putative oxidoreductase
MNSNISSVDTTSAPTSLFARLAPLAEPLVRIAAGAMLMPHGAQKLFGWFGGYGLTATGQYFDTLGMRPGILFATTAGVIEFFGGLLLVIGLFTRPVALIVAAFLAVALMQHVANGFFWTEGGVEYPLLWCLVALAIFFRGADRYSVDARRRDRREIGV